MFKYDLKARVILKLHFISNKNWLSVRMLETHFKRNNDTFEETFIPDTNTVLPLWVIYILKKLAPIRPRET
jgi:hypothetical protein